MMNGQAVRGIMAMSTIKIQIQLPTGSYDDRFETPWSDLDPRVQAWYNKLGELMPKIGRS